MATFTLSHITDLVALRLHEFPDCHLELPDAGLHTSLREMVRVAAEDVACRITREAPIEAFTETTDFRRLLLTDSDWGEPAYAELELPSGFCRLHSLRLPGWQRTLSESFTGDTLRASLAEEAPEWMASRPGRPWLRLINRAGRMTLRFGPPVAAMPADAAYIPLPRFDTDDDWLTDFDPALLPNLADALAKLVAEE